MSKKAKKQKFRVIFLATIDIELDPKVIAQVDDDFRENYYNLKKPEDIAQHIAYNILFNNAELSQLDGFANLKDEMVEVLDKDVDCEGSFITS